jgi:hypothetical protein
MVRAILDGRKTQTRLVVKGQCEHTIMEHDGAICRHCDHGSGYYKCPYGGPGDRLWVREKWRPFFWDEDLWDCIEYKADGTRIKPQGLDEDTGHRFSDMCDAGDPNPRWRPSIHMPRWASRITIEIVKVRVERVQEISLNDIEAEGTPYSLHQERRPVGSRTEQFAELWDSINAKRRFGWSVNPWVWVIEFRRIA